MYTTTQEKQQKELPPSCVYILSLGYNCYTYRRVLFRDESSHRWLPSVPEYFFGRSDIVREAAHKLVQLLHVALTGTGGIGKTSIARAVVNEGDVVEKFGDERYFVAFDDHLGTAGRGDSSITFDVFADHIANALGLHPNKADKEKMISCPVYYDGESVSGQVRPRPPRVHDCRGSCGQHRIALGNCTGSRWKEART